MLIETIECSCSESAGCVGVTVDRSVPAECIPICIAGLHRSINPVFKLIFEQLDEIYERPNTSMYGF